MSMEVGVELEDLEQPSSPLPGDDVPLIQREGEPAPESFENRENKHDGQRTSILTRQTSGKLEGTSQRTVTQESVIKETEEHTKSTFVSVVQRNIDDNPFIEPLPEKQDPDIPTPKDHLTREKQAELRRLDDLEAADRGYTPRMNVEEMEREEETLFFEEFDKDTKRSLTYRIDYVLVYKEDDSDGRGCFSSMMRCVRRRRKPQEIRMLRERFLERAEEMGLKIKEQPKEKSEDKKTSFVWVHCPWDLLMEGAEKIGLKMPVNDKLMPLDRPWHQKLLETRTSFKSPLAPKEPEDFQIHPYLRAPFKKDYQQQFIECDAHNADKFFSTEERAMIVHSLLDSVNYSLSQPQDKTMFGLGQAVEMGLFVAEYPLHDGSYNTKADGIIHCERQFLFKEWIHWKSWHKTQPIHHIRRYFGIKIGIYFAFLGHITTWLLYASILGAAVMVYGISTLTTNRNPVAADVCGVPYAKYVNTSQGLVPPNSTTLYMCPLCDINCDFWYYQTACLSSRFSLLFDNGGTVFFAAFMSLWAVLFLEFWKRKQYRLQHEWDVLEYELVEETPRAQFLREIKKQIRRDPLTNEEIIPRRLLRYNHVFERYDIVQPQGRFVAKLIAAFSGLLLVAVVVLGIVFAVLIYRAAIALILYLPLSTIAGSYTGTGTNLFVLVTAALIQLVMIMIMNVIYKIIAVWLNNWELHRTQSEFEDSLVWKLYIFQFVNYYTSIFYIAFFKGNIVGYPGKYNRIGIIRLEECSTYGCFLELTIQLVIILCGKQILYQAIELGVPILKWFLARVKNFIRGKEDKDPVYARWERDYDLSAQPKFGLLPEYLELAVQYGFVTLFVAAFPLAPLFAFLNNVIEVRLDAYKYVVASRRAVPKRAEDIGAWYGILDVVSKLAVVTNACLIAFTSDFIPQLVYKHSSFSPESCARYNWPSCSVGQEFVGLGGFLDFRLQEFSIESIFDEIRGCSLKDPGCRGQQVVPRIDVYSLRAVRQDPGREEVEELPYLFLPFLNVTCLSDRLSNETLQRIAGMKDIPMDFELSYSDITPEVADIPDVYQNAVYCVNSATKCSFRGYGNTGPGGRIPYENSLVIIGRLAFILAFEHVIFVLVAVIAIIIPDIPKRVKDEIRREKILAQTAKVTIMQKDGPSSGTLHH